MLNFVSDPSLQVYKDTTGNENWELITTNDNWGTLSETGGTYSIASVTMKIKLCPINLIIIKTILKTPRVNVPSL